MPLCCDALARTHAGIHRRAAMSSEGNGNSSAKDVPCEDEETSLSFSSWPRGASHGQRDTQEGSSEVAVPLMSLTSFATSKPRREAAGFLPCSFEHLAFLSSIYDANRRPDRSRAVADL